MFITTPINQAVTPMCSYPTNPSLASCGQILSVRADFCASLNPALFVLIIHGLRNVFLGLFNSSLFMFVTFLRSILCSSFSVTRPVWVTTLTLSSKKWGRCSNRWLVLACLQTINKFVQSRWDQQRQQLLEQKIRDHKAAEVRRACNLVEQTFASKILIDSSSFWLFVSS